MKVKVKICELHEPYGYYDDMEYSTRVTANIDWDEVEETEIPDIRDGLHLLNCKRRCQSRYVLLSIPDDSENVIDLSLDEVRKAVEKAKKEKEKQEKEKAKKAEERKLKTLERKKKQLEKIQKEIEEAERIKNDPMV